MVNEIILTGRLVGDPAELRTKTGTEIARFTLAVERELNANAQDKKTDFISCVAFNKTATFINAYIKKGSLVAVVGSLYQSTYTNKNGTEIKTFDVNVRTLTSLVASKKKIDKEALKENEEYYTPAPAPTDDADLLSDDDLPF